MGRACSIRWQKRLASAVLLQEPLSAVIAFFLAAAVTAIFYYPALRHGSLDAAGILYGGDVLGLYWPSMIKTHVLLAGKHFTALDFSQYNGSSDYFLAPNFFVLHPIFVVYCLVTSPEGATMQDYGRVHGSAHGASFVHCILLLVEAADALLWLRVRDRSFRGNRLWRSA